MGGPSGPIAAVWERLLAATAFGPEGPPTTGHGQVAQLVEQRTENPRVGGSIPPLATNLFKKLGASVTVRLFFLGRVWDVFVESIISQTILSRFPSQLHLLIWAGNCNDRFL